MHLILKISIFYYLNWSIMASGGFLIYGLEITRREQYACINGESSTGSTFIYKFH
jgi:hypothetical protein